MPKFWNETEVYARDAGMDQKIEYDGSNNAIYIGSARPGTSVDSLLWSVYKLTYDVSNNMTDKRFADGTDDFTKSWTLRATYTYI
jgi:hypothetical protein